MSSKNGRECVSIIDLMTALTYEKKINEGYLKRERCSDLSSKGRSGACFSRRGAEFFAESHRAVGSWGFFSRKDAEGAEKETRRKLNHGEHIGEIEKASAQIY